ncbi:MAG: type II secretion system secretin GspD [Pseudomonadota bacterium]
MAVLAAVPAGAQDSRLNLRDADLSVFVELVSELTGRNFIVDPRVQGTVTVFAPDTLSDEAVFEIFLKVLALNRFALVEGEGADRIVPAQLGRELSEFRDNTVQSGFVTRAIPVTNVPLTEAVEIITPLLPSEAVVSTYEVGNLIILSASAADIDRMSTLLGRLDAARPSRVVVLNVRNAAAESLAETLQSMELASPGANVTADPRSNTLIVSGSDEFRAMVQALVRELDRPRNSSDAVVVSLQYAKAEQVAAIGQSLFGGQSGEAEGVGGAASIVADTQTNSVLISASPDLLPSIVRAMRALDQRPRQVLVEGVIFETSAQAFTTLGVQFGGVVKEVFAAGVQFNVGGIPTLSNLITALLGNAPANLPNGGTLAIGDKDRLALGFLSAVARDSSTNILSTPSILTLDNEEAEITVAQNVPFVTGSFSTVGNSPVPNQPFQTIQRQDVGLILNVVPQITGDGTVRLRVRQEVSNLTAAAAASGSEITQRREIQTSVIVGDGNVLLLGGLMEDFSNDENERVPGLGDIPILKRLFSADGKEKNKRVLLLLLRTNILEGDEAANAATEAAYSRALQKQREITASQDKKRRKAGSGAATAIPSLGAPFVAKTPGKSQSSTALPPLGARLKLGK